MHNSKMNEKEALYSLWDVWLNMKEKIEDAYKQKNPEATNMMEKAIENYLAMVGLFLPDDSSQGNRKSSIEPLNGIERLQFIRRRIGGYFAFVQLDALYTEAMKKAVSRLAMKK